MFKLQSWYRKTRRFHRRTRESTQVAESQYSLDCCIWLGSEECRQSVIQWQRENTSPTSSITEPRFKPKSSPADWALGHTIK